MNDAIKQGAKILPFLIAHTSQSGRDIAQAKVEATSETQALEIFAIIYPSRVVTVVGIREQN